MTRIALYSHDALGLGHLRRNLAIAAVLARPGTAVLVICGATEAGAFKQPEGVDLLTLPALAKSPRGGYEARSLPLALPQVLALRGQTIRAALGAFDPDALVVDKLPRGVGGELDLALRALPARTRTVLGLREVLDEPAVVRDEWQAMAHDRAIEAHYDAVWVYGDRRVYDPVAEYGLSAGVAAKVRYTGYLDRRCISAPEGGSDPPSRPYALCTVGGGEDGAELAEAFARAPRPDGLDGVVVTGPFMPAPARDRLHELAEQRRGLRVLEFLDEPGRLMAQASAVVAMGGYNTTCELLSRGTRALVVPRVAPRREQAIRAARLRDLGLLDVLAPEHLSPQAIGAWLARDGEPMRGSAHDRIDLGGLRRLPGLLDELLAQPSPRQELDLVA